MRFHFHHWEKWRVYVRQYRTLIGDKDYPCSQTRQRRACERCGYVQDEVVLEGEETKEG